jgi:hypothetical protein
MNTVRPRLAGLSTVAILALWHVPGAYAQLTAPREAAQLQFGPLSIYPSLRVVDVGIDDNVFNNSVAEQDDYTFTIASRVMSVLKMGPNELITSVGGDYVWFKDYASQRSTNANYGLRFNMSASRLKPFVGGERFHTSTRPNVEIDTRARRVENLLLAGTNFDISERMALTATVQYSDATYDEDEQFRGVPLDQALNQTARTYSAGVRYAVTPLTTFSVLGNYSEDIFTHSPLRNSKSYSVTPMVEFAPEAVIRGSFAAGYELFAPDDPELAEHRGLIFEGNVNWSISARTTFDVTARRAVNYSYEDTEPMYLQTGVRLLATQRLFGPVGVRGSYERQYLTYRWLHGVPPTPGIDARQDTADILGGGVTVDLGRGFSAVFGAERMVRRSEEDFRQNFNRTRIITNITIGQ